MNQKELQKYLLSLPNVKAEHPFEPEVTVYQASGQMFALIEDGKAPIRLSLRCDSELADLLRQRYEEVLPGHKLNPKHWNTILLTGQLGSDEVKALIAHSYNLALQAQGSTAD